MSKKKKTMGTNVEKDISKLMEEINKQDFRSVDTMNDFMNKFIGKKLDDLPERTDKKARSQDLVYEAYEQSISKGRQLVKQALELDPNNADAYNYLASIEKDIDNAIKQFKKAIEAGEKSIGAEKFKEGKGHFWGIFETRPYMRAKAGLADCLNAKNETDKAIEIYEEMLELNPNDNQGIRYLLSTLLLGKTDLGKYENFIKKSEDENSAVWNYNNALYSFKKLGQTIKSEKTLMRAYKSNVFVIDYMLGNKEMPDELPRHIGFGDENEAISYVNDAWIIWHQTGGALGWIYNFKKKLLKFN